MWCFRAWWADFIYPMTNTTAVVLLVSVSFQAAVDAWVLWRLVQHLTRGC